MWWYSIKGSAPSDAKEHDVVVYFAAVDLLMIAGMS